MKKKLAAVLATMLLLTGCGSSAAPAATGDAAPAADGQTYKVGICQLVQHDALDAATQGFQDALKEALGDAVTFDVQNAQGDSTTCATITNSFAANSYDLIMANATPALQAAVASTNTIPIVGTSVTDYATALAMDNFSGTTGINVTGTSDLAPLDQQEDMILELVPDAKKVGILYCSGEANSDYQAKTIEKYLDEDKIAYEEFTFADSNDLQAVVSSAVGAVDVLYIPTDNTAASNMTIISNVCQPAGMPVICGEENMMLAGGLATLSISYYDIGFEAGKMAAQILKDGVDPSTMEIGTASTTTKKYSTAYAEAIGFTVPEGYEGVQK